MVKARVQSQLSSLVGTLSWICSMSSFSRISDSPWSFGSESCSLPPGSSPHASPSMESEELSLAPIWKSYYPNQETTSGSTRWIFCLISLYISKIINVYLISILCMAILFWYILHIFCYRLKIFVHYNKPSKSICKILPNMKNYVYLHTTYMLNNYNITPIEKSSTSDKVFIHLYCMLTTQILFIGG